jgi:hypothetical protein
MIVSSVPVPVSEVVNAIVWVSVPEAVSEPVTITETEPLSTLVPESDEDRRTVME